MGDIDLVSVGTGAGVEGPMMGPVSRLAMDGGAEPQKSPYGVSQGGFLLFASANARSMPGGVLLRRITFHNQLLPVSKVEEAYLNSRY